MSDLPKFITDVDNHPPILFDLVDYAANLAGTPDTQLPPVEYLELVLFANHESRIIELLNGRYLAADFARKAFERMLTFSAALGAAPTRSARQRLRARLTIAWRPVWGRIDRDVEAACEREVLRYQEQRKFHVDHLFSTNLYNRLVADARALYVEV